MSLVNRQVLVQYDVPGPVLWHERLVMFHVDREEYIVATPDSDVFVEDLSLLNDDLRGIRVKPNAGVLPPGIPAGQVYPLPAFDAGALAALRAVGTNVLNQERAARGLGGGVAAAPAAAAAGAAPAPVIVADQLYWIAAESLGKLKFGDQVQGVGAALVEGSKSIHTLADGSSLFVQCMKGSDVPAFKTKPGGWTDFRTTSIEQDAMGKAETSLKQVAQKSQEIEMDWTLSGPRTSRWCLSYLLVENLGLEGHHERFRQLCKLDSSSWGIQEHYQLSMTLKYAIQSDQLNPYNNLFCEVIFRRLQTIEFAYMERAREQEAKAVGGKLSLEEQSTFGGLTRAAATLMVCPQLLEHVRGEVDRDAQLSKNLRKAREERELARKNTKKGQDKDAPWGVRAVGVGSLLPLNQPILPILHVSPERRGTSFHCL